MRHLLLLLCLVLLPGLGHAASEVSVGVDVGGPNATAPFASAPDPFDTPSAGTSTAPPRRGAPGSAGSSKAPEASAVRPGDEVDEAAGVTPPSFEPGAGREPLHSERLDAILTLDIDGRAARSRVVSLVFDVEEDGAIFLLSLDDRRLDGLQNASLLDALREALVDAASDDLGTGARVRFAENPRTRIKAGGTRTRLRIRGDLVVEAPGRVRDADFQLRAVLLASPSD